jgi:DNA-binding XRE family transcriptional regulator
MNQKPKTISLNELTKNFTAEQKQIMEAEVKYYDLLVKFREAREDKGITQAELAEMANINRTTLSQIESGLRNATIDTLVRIARALGLNLELSLS